MRAVDTTGNESALMNGSAYVAGVTQEILVDYKAPDITVTAPAANQVVYESQAVTILWTLTDTTPAASVKIEYTLDYNSSPEWHEIVATTPNDGRYDWTSPEVDGNKEHARIRITAVDLAGPIVGDVIGHTTQALSGQFSMTDTAFDLPAPVTELLADDPDVVEPGVNGFDFHATWVLSISTNIATQKVYILPSTVNFLDLSANQPVAVLGNSATTWTGNAAITKDSANHTLIGSDYKIWILVTDTNGRSATTKSAAFPVVSET